MHRVVDQPKGDVANGLRGRATSIDAASAALGVVAKIDVVEDDPETGGAIVVDIKTGEPMSDGEAWPGDAAQALAGAIALRDSGYNCRRTAVWYARPRQRVTLDVSADRERWLADLVAEMHTVAASASAPPSLLASPRCPTCSLVGICLPDEENDLTTRTGAAPRRSVCSLAAHSRKQARCSAATKRAKVRQRLTARAAVFLSCATKQLQWSLAPDPRGRASSRAGKSPDRAERRCRRDCARVVARAGVAAVGKQCQGEAGKGDHHCQLEGGGAERLVC